MAPNEAYLGGAALGYPDAGLRIPVSTGGGTRPQWSRSGGELLYLAPGDMLTAVSVRTGGAEPDLGEARPLFKLRLPSQRGGNLFDTNPDGTRILVIEKIADAPRRALTVIQNWTGTFKTVNP